MSLTSAIKSTFEKVRNCFEGLAYAVDYDPVEQQQRWITEIERRLRRVEDRLGYEGGERRNEAPDD